MSAAERAYQLLLRAYPRGFRDEYGREMALAFRDQGREVQRNAARFWAETLVDIARSAPRLQLEALRLRGDRIIQTGEGTMTKMTMAILAIMIGALEAMNALQEVWGAGIVSHDSRALLGGTIAMVAGALLITAGIALLRRSPNAAALAQAAAVTCLVVFAFLALALPLLSGFAILLGIGFPIALFAFAHWDRPRDIGAPILS